MQASTNEPAAIAYTIGFRAKRLVRQLVKVLLRPPLMRLDARCQQAIDSRCQPIASELTQNLARTDLLLRRQEQLEERQEQLEALFCDASALASRLASIEDHVETLLNKSAGESSRV